MRARASERGELAHNLFCHENEIGKMCLGEMRWKCVHAYIVTVTGGARDGDFVGWDMGKAAG